MQRIILKPFMGLDITLIHYKDGNTDHYDLYDTE